MNSEDLALLLGLVGGGFGGYFGSKRKEERERAQKKEDREDLAKFERELAAQLREDARLEKETAEFKEQGRFTEGENRGELKNPNSLYNFLFNPSESDPIHEMLGGGTLADALVGTTAYDDPNIRNQQREDFVANPEDNFLTTTGGLGLASLAIPGMGLLRGAGLASKLGPSMMAGLRSYFSRPGTTPITDPARLLPAPMNQGGRVGLGVGGDPMDMADIIKLLELDMSLGGGPNIGSVADSGAGSGDAMRDAGFKTIMELLSD